jgi:hypothetical protein
MKNLAISVFASLAIAAQPALVSKTFSKDIAPLVEWPTLSSKLPAAKQGVAFSLVSPFAGPSKLCFEQTHSGRVSRAADDSRHARSRERQERLVTARRFPPPWSVEEQGVSKQMWPYYINMNFAEVRKRSEMPLQLTSWCLLLLVALGKAGP